MSQFQFSLEPVKVATFKPVVNGRKLLISHGKKTGFIPCFNLPALKTCGLNVPCKHVCYACKGRYNYPNVKKAYVNNFNYAKNHMADFFNHLDSYLKYTQPAFFRWFGSGDCFSIKFFNGIVETARNNPNTRFLMFTKRFLIVNAWCKAHGGRDAIPNNLIVRFSAWDEKFKVLNPYGFPVFYVNFKVNNKFGWRTPEQARTASPCNEGCQGCFKCWTPLNIIVNQHTY